MVQPMKKQVTLDEAVQLVEQLSPMDKVRLIEKFSYQIQRELMASRNKPRKSLRGLWKGSNITDSDIAEVRQEMWKNFPREDI